MQVRLSEELAELSQTEKQLREARKALRSVTEHADSLVSNLKGARNWGVWDMMGGGGVSSFVKHMEVDAANKAARRVARLHQHHFMEYQRIDSLRRQHR